MKRAGTYWLRNVPSDAMWGKGTPDEKSTVKATGVPGFGFAVTSKKFQTLQSHFNFIQLQPPSSVTSDLPSTTLAFLPQPIILSHRNLRRNVWEVCVGLDLSALQIRTRHSKNDRTQPAIMDHHTICIQPSRKVAPFTHGALR